MKWLLIFCYLHSVSSLLYSFYLFLFLYIFHFSVFYVYVFVLYNKEINHIHASLIHSFLVTISNNFQNHNSSFLDLFKINHLSQSIYN